MDPRTRQRIARMDVAARRQYVHSIEQELERALDKQRRLEHGVRCAGDDPSRASAMQRLKRLQKQIASLNEIVHFAGSDRLR